MTKELRYIAIEGVIGAGKTTLAKCSPKIFFPINS